MHEQLESEADEHVEAVDVQRAARYVIRPRDSEHARIFADHFARGRFHAEEMLAGRNPVESGCICRNCAPARKETWTV